MCVPTTIPSSRSAENSTHISIKPLLVITNFDIVTPVVFPILGSARITVGYTEFLASTRARFITMGPSMRAAQWALSSLSISPLRKKQSDKRFSMRKEQRNALVEFVASVPDDELKFMGV